MRKKKADPAGTDTTGLRPVVSDLNRWAMHTMKLVSVLTLLSLAVTASAKPTITIGDQLFILAHEEKNDNGSLREFLPPGEKLASWKRLVSIREFHQIADPKQYIGSLAKGVLAQNPKAKFSLSEDKLNGDWLIDSILASPDPKNRFIEWNVFRARKATHGIIVFQHAARYSFKESVTEIVGQIPQQGTGLSRDVYNATFTVQNEPNK